MHGSLRLLVLVSLLLAACRTTPEYGRPLPPGAPALLKLEPGDRKPDFGPQFYERDEILPALDRSIAWTRLDHARQFFPIEGVSHARALRSLERFREILTTSDSASEFSARLDLDFEVYKSAGWDGKGGGVLFTGYCTPILPGDTSPSATYRYPLYALPPDLVKGEHGEILGRRTASGGLEPYPTRRAIEAGALLEDQGLELVWLRDPLDAFIAHVNGSAFVELPDGSQLKFGYAGKNGRPYTSLGAELIAAGELEASELSLAGLREWAAENPGRLQPFLDENESYVFFTPIDGTPRGSLNVPVEPGRTIATDKTLFPRGALVYVDTTLPGPAGPRLFERFVLDQDTGGAIRTAGRADLYLGIGPEAERRAGATKAEGQMYYLFVRE